ncbi:hypothetical protein M409DRAFT_28894 [Zasmidium cellare ATCC 36951]|uniref:Phosphatidylinositol-specific phospholipase C X domain-containing protein n=1 Tax=Zasmidium cellare ATCC 36951 TaxID=1080233 RepID=A0A6A6C397_ZASCE|nr:uncharacterized protein M409DRAFT_28894 [Zasmidium cellare ATCC 36951]KAF2160758.1 hypothetical protein M409DRAFT_28894 [Zasmidium cellare ATCC 36951]
MKIQDIFPVIATHGFLIQPVSGNFWRHSHGKADELRMNQIQVVGTHNSYHREISLSERKQFEEHIPSPENYYYSHSKWTDQLDHQQVRSFEIDLHSDTKGGLYAYPLIWKLSNLTNETAPFHDPNMLKPGLKVFHVTDADTNAICHTFVECLTQLKNWSDAHPHHLPLTFDLELKNDALGCFLGGVCAEEAKNWTTAQILEVDREIRSVLPSNKLIVPDDIRKPGLTLEESVLQHGWPTLKDSRGKFMFYFDNDPDSDIKLREKYRADGHESLQNRTVFTNAVEGEADCAFIKHNSPDVKDIQRLVKKGYFVRTRADEPITTILARNTTMRDQAFESAAHVVSTDYPAYGMSTRWDWDYAVQLDGGKIARCNAVTAPKWCRDEMLQ